MSSTTGPKREQILSVFKKPLRFTQELMLANIERHLKQANPDLSFDAPFNIPNAVATLKQAERNCHLYGDNLLGLISTQIHEQISDIIDIEVQQLKDILRAQNLNLRVIALDGTVSGSWLGKKQGGYIEDIDAVVQKLNSNQPKIEVAILDSQIEQIKRNFPVPFELNKLLGRLDVLSLKKQKKLKLEFVNLIKVLTEISQQPPPQETLLKFYRIVATWKQKAREAYIKKIFKKENVLTEELCNEMKETIKHMQLFDVEMPADIEQITLNNFSDFLQKQIGIKPKIIELIKKLDKKDIPPEQIPSQDTTLISIIRHLEYVRSKIEELHEKEAFIELNINDLEQKKLLIEAHEIYQQIIREHSKELPLFLDANAPAAIKFVDDIAADKPASKLQTILGWMSWIGQTLGAQELDIAKTSVMAGPVSVGAMQLIQKAITGTVKDKIEGAIAGRFEGKFTQKYEKGDFDVKTPMRNIFKGAKADYVNTFYLTNLRKLDIKLSYLEQTGETHGQTYRALKNVFAILEQHHDEIRNGSNPHHFNNDLNLIMGMLKANKENLYVKAIESTQQIQRYLKDGLQISREATQDPIFKSLKSESLRGELTQCCEFNTQMTVARRPHVQMPSILPRAHELTIYNNDRKLLAQLHFMNNLNEDILAIEQELELIEAYRANIDLADFIQTHDNALHEKLTKVEDVLNLKHAVDRLVKDDPSVLIAWWEDNVLKKYIFMPQEQRRGVASLTAQNEKILAAKKLTKKMHEGKSLWHILVDLPEGQGELIFQLLMEKLDAAPAGATEPWELGDIFDPNVTFNGMNPMEYAKSLGKHRMYHAFLKRLATCRRSMSEDEVTQALTPLFQKNKNAQIILDYMDKWIKETYPKRMLGFLSKLREIPKDLVTKGFSGTLMELKYLSKPEVIKRQVKCSLLMWADKHQDMPRTQSQLMDFMRNLHLSGGQCTTVPVDMLLEKTYAPEAMKDRDIENGAIEMSKLLNMENALIDYIESKPHDEHLQRLFEVFTSHILQSKRSDHTNAMMQQMLIALVEGELEGFINFYKNEFRDELIGGRNLFYLACEIDQAEIAKFLHFTKGVAGDGGPEIEDTKTNHPLQTFYENQRTVITETALTCAARQSPRTFLTLCDAVEKTNRATPSGLFRFCMDSHGKAPIHYAFESMPFSHIKAYLDLEHLRWDRWNGDRVNRLWNMPDKEGNHPLHLLARRKDASEIVSALIDYTENTYRKGYLGNNLFKYCIDINCLASKNHFGESILGLLRQNGNFRALALILDQAIKHGIGINNARAILNDRMLHPENMDDKSLAFLNYELMRIFDQNKSNRKYVTEFKAFATLTENNQLLTQIESGQSPKPPSKSKALIVRQPYAQGAQVPSASDEELDISSEEDRKILADRIEKGKEEEGRPVSTKKKKGV